jgi:hypothetical protein
MSKKNANSYSERMTVNLTPDQMRRLEELRNVRARVGKYISKNDLLRDAVNYYLAAQEDLPGSRRAIAKGIESKVDTLDAKVEALTTLFTDFVNSICDGVTLTLRRRACAYDPEEQSIEGKVSVIWALLFGLTSTIVNLLQIGRIKAAI